MLDILLIICAIVALVFTSIWAYRAWGAGATVGTVLCGGLIFLFLPFGSIICIVAGVIMVPLAQKARIAKLVAEDD